MKGSQNKKTVILSILLVTFSVFSLYFFCEREKRTEARYFPIIERYAAEFSLDPALVKAVVKTESGYDEKAVSEAGAAGLMQIMPETFPFVCKKFGITGDIFDPETNVRAGCAYLSYLFARFENEQTVLAAYNAGEGNVKLWLSDNEYSEDGVTLKRIPFDETRNFVLSVEGRQKNYK